MQQPPSRNEDKQTWLELRINQEKTIARICKNLIAAEVLRPEEQERYSIVLRGYDAQTTLKCLIHSHWLLETHEEAGH